MDAPQSQIRRLSEFQRQIAHECLNKNVFIYVHDARSKIESWRRDYNSTRPHSSLNNLHQKNLLALYPNQAESLTFCWWDEGEMVTLSGTAS
jgi:putative transposase